MQRIEADMKCPKCQFDNDRESIFCERCDHRLDRPYRGRDDKTALSPIFAAVLALGLGAFSVLLVFTKTLEWYIPVALGAAGIVIGTYSLRIAGTVGEKDRMFLFALAGAAVMLSVIGFVMGIGMYS
jgi:FtsH-binding integral membrane protein